MNRKRLLDSFALLAYLNKEANFERVKGILAVAQKSGDFVLMIVFLFPISCGNCESFSLSNPKYKEEKRNQDSVEV